jgi:hypothetical protein
MQGELELARLSRMGPRAVEWYRALDRCPAGRWSRWWIAVLIGLCAAGMRIEACAEGSPPAAPSDLVVTPLSGSDMRLSWVDRSDNETGFGLWRRSGLEEWRRIAVLPPNKHETTDRGLLPGRTYSYRLRAHNSSGASDWLRVAQVTTPAVPGRPRHLMAGALSGTQISLTWIHPGIATTGIGIWRRVNGGDWLRVGVAPPAASTYLDMGLLPDTLYQYQVRAHNNEGASDWSEVATCLTASALSVRHFAPEVRSAGSRTRIDLGFFLPASLIVAGSAAVRSIGPHQEAMEFLPAIVTGTEPSGRGYGFLTTGTYRPGVYLIRAEISYLMPGGVRNTIVSPWSRMVVP